MIPADPDTKVRPPTTIDDVVLKMGGFHFGGGRTKIRARLGSCVSITLWHPRLKIGGMCHYQLPGRAADAGTLTAAAGNYAEDAMQMFLSELSKSDTRPEDYIVKLFGGASVGAAGQSPSARIDSGIDPFELPHRNVAAGRELLSSHGFKLCAEHTGGSGSLLLVFELWSGDIWLRRESANGAANSLM